MEGPVDGLVEPLPPDFSETPIFRLFELAAARDPAAGALVIGDVHLTYGALHRQALALAEQIDAVTPPDAAVAILLGVTVDAVVAFLACLAARRIALVLNADHPAERNAEILRDAQAAAVITARSTPLPEGLPRGLVRIVPTPAATATGAAADGSGATGSAAADSAATDSAATESAATGSAATGSAATGTPWLPPAPAAPDAPAVVLYTSGSAGRPKGIVLSQFSLLYRARRNIVGAHLNRTDRLLPLSGLGTVNGCSYIVAILLAGGTLLQFPMTSLRDLRAVIGRQQITALIGLPRILDMLVDANGSDALTSLRMLRSTGEGMRPNELRALRAALPEHCAINITYGMTEASVTHWWVPRDFIPDEALVPSGHICEGVEFVILGEDGAAVADGAVGQMVVRSRVVALGEFTGGCCVPGRMLPDPADPTRRIFATGDLVRLRPDGLVQFVARGDRQIKVNGQRVEPAEIEDAIRLVPGVAEAVVIAAGGEASPVLLGFVVPAPATDPRRLHDAVRSALRHRLPGIMRPSTIVVLPHLPRLPSGKLDRQTLLARARHRPSILRPLATRARAWLVHLSRGSGRGVRAHGIVAAAVAAQSDSPTEQGPE
jgi:acyl-coenzyme A synthetase/AMP-(fatty) acid ligase